MEPYKVGQNMTALILPLQHCKIVISHSICLVLADRQNMKYYRPTELQGCQLTGTNDVDNTERIDSGKENAEWCTVCLVQMTTT